MAESHLANAFRRDSIPEMRLLGRVVNRVSIHFPIQLPMLRIASRKLDILFYIRKTFANGILKWNSQNFR